MLNVAYRGIVFILQNSLQKMNELSDEEKLVGSNP